MLLLWIFVFQFLPVVDSLSLTLRLFPPTQYVLAAEDYKRALRFEARNQDCLQELQRCLTAIEDDCKRKLAEQPQNESARKLWKRAKEDYKLYITQVCLLLCGTFMTHLLPSFKTIPPSYMSLPHHSALTHHRRTWQLTCHRAVR